MKNLYLLGPEQGLDQLVLTVKLFYELTEHKIFVTKSCYKESRPTYNYNQQSSLQTHLNSFVLLSYANTQSFTPGLLYSIPPSVV